VNWFTALPHGLQAAALLTAFAAALLATAGALQHSRRAAAVLGGLGAVIAALPALSAGDADALAIVGTCALALVAMLLLPAAELQFDEHRLEGAGLILLGAAGGIVLATSTHLLAMVLGLETLSLAVAVLCGLGRGSRPLEASFKFFVLAAVSLATMVYGIGLHAYATGSFEIGAPLLAGSALRSIHTAAVVLITLGLLFELAVVPVHFGALGVYMSAPAGFAGLAMTASKLGAGIAMLRVTAAMDPAIIGPILTGLGLGSIVWATFAGLAQRELRSMLAYSAIAHAGFIALALGCGAEGRAAAVFYLVVYVASAALVFSALAGRGAEPIPFASLRDRPLGTLRTMALVAGLLSLAGVPPGPGLWAKIGVLLPVWRVAGPLLTLVAALGGVFGALYYLRPLPDLLAGLRRGERATADLGARAAVVLAGGAVLLFTVLPWVGTQLATLAPR